MNQRLLLLLVLFAVGAAISSGFAGDEMAPSLAAYFEKVKALATDKDHTGRISKNELKKDGWQSLSGVQNYHDNPKIVGDGVVLEDYDFTGKCIFVAAKVTKAVIRNCVWDQTGQKVRTGPTAWILLEAGCSNITIEYNNFIGRDGSDNINGGIASPRCTNTLQPTNILLQHNRFLSTSADYLKQNFGKGSVIRYNHFGPARLFDEDVTLWSPDKSYAPGDRVLYKQGLYAAITQNANAKPSGVSRQGDTAEWKCLGEKPHFDYVQGTTGGPVKYYGNLFEVGTTDKEGMRQINQVLRWVREFSGNGDINGLEFVGNVCLLAEGNPPPLFPYGISAGNHPETVNAPWVFAYNILIKGGKNTGIDRNPNTTKNIHWFQNFYLDGTPVPLPSGDLVTDDAIVLPPPPPGE